MFFQIPQSMRTVSKEWRGPVIPVRQCANAWGKLPPPQQPQEPGSSGLEANAPVTLPPHFQPVEPRRDASSGLKPQHVAIDETLVMRLVVPAPVELFLTPATIAALEEAQVRWSFGCLL